MTDGLCRDSCVAAGGGGGNGEAVEKVAGAPVMLSGCEDERVKGLDPQSESFKDDLKALGLFVFFFLVGWWGCWVYHALFETEERWMWIYRKEEVELM